MKLCRDTMWIEPGDRERLARAGLDTVDRVLKCLGDQVVAWSRTTEVVRADLPDSCGGGAVYIKRYHRLRWRKRIQGALRGTLFGRSRARAEFEQLRRMRAGGAPVVRAIAWGERRVLFFLRSSFLMTEAVEGSVSLTTFAQQQHRSTLPPSVRHEFVRSLGGCIRDLHARGHIHGALFWRNVLVRRSPGGGFEFHLLDAQAPRRLRPGALNGRHAGRLTDLAEMAAVAPVFCSRAEMLRFLRAYLGTDRLDGSHRKLIGEILRRAAPLRDHELYRLKMNRVFHYHLVPT